LKVKMIPGALRPIYLTASDIGAASLETPERTFERFAAKERGSITGKGLAAAYGIAKKNGGLSTLPTRRKTAVCFGVYLPETPMDEVAMDLVPEAAEMKGIPFDKVKTGC
jgi:hypothetical protein